LPQNPFTFEKEPNEHRSKDYLEALPRSNTGLYRFFKIYVKGFRGASELRNQLFNTKSIDEVRSLLNNFGEEC